MKREREEEGRETKKRAILNPETEPLYPFVRITEPTLEFVGLDLELVPLEDFHPGVAWATAEYDPDTLRS